MQHRWIPYAGGAAHCPNCGAVRLANGEIKVPHPAMPGAPPLCEEPPTSPRSYDGVIVTGPEAPE